MKNRVTCLLTMTLFTFFSCNNNQAPILNATSNSQVSPTKKTPEQLRSELKADELIAPKQYLSIQNATISDSMFLVVKPSLFTHSQYSQMGNNIKGVIRNSATIAEYKDVVLHVSYYSQTQTLIGSKDYIIYEYYEPSSTKQFYLHVYPPNAWKNFSVELKTATGIN